MDAARTIIPIIVQLSLAAMLLSVALESRWANVLAQLREPGLLFRGIVAVNIVVPLVAILIILLFPLDRPVAVGLFLMAVSPLAPLMPGNAVKAGATRSHVLGLYAPLILLAIAIVPITVLLADKIFAAHAVAPVLLIAKAALVSAVLPILIGLAVRAAFPDFATQAAKWLTLVSNLILLLLMIVIFWKMGREFLDLVGNGAILAFGATTGVGIVAGHLLGGPEKGDRCALAMAAAVRHPGIAAMIGHASGMSPQALAAIILFLINSVVVTSLYRLWLKRR